MGSGSNPAWMASVEKVVQSGVLMPPRYEAGGGDFHYVPWGNDSEGAVASLEEQARIALAGWV